MRQQKCVKIGAVDLFCGIVGLTHGLQMAGVTVKARRGLILIQVANLLSSPTMPVQNLFTGMSSQSISGKLSITTGMRTLLRL